MNVAVIIPTRDRPELLERAVESARNQTKPAYEIIVINDNGIPVSPKGCILVEAQGKGLTRARKVGMSVLSPNTDAVCYLDDDDELLPNHIGQLSEKLEEGHEFAFSKAIYRYPNGTETEDPEPNNKDPNKAYYNPDSLLKQNIAPVSSFMHTRRAYDKIGGWDENIIRIEDWDLWGRMFIEFGPPGFVNTVTNIIYKGLGTNLTDSSPFSYSMCCHWRDYVEAKLRGLNDLKNAQTEPQRTLIENYLKTLHIPKVTVLMPVYNAEKYLYEALQSLKVQTFTDFEIVAVNDGSTDKSRSILEKFATNRINMRIFDLPQNQGVTRALNHGLLMSRTELIARMDADDVALPERLEKQVNFLDNNQDIGIVGTRFWSMTEDLKTIKWTNNIPTEPEEISKVLLDHCCIGHPTVMMRRRVPEIIGGYNESPQYKAVEDYEFWLRALKKFKIANLPDFLLKYREYDGQISKELSSVQKCNTEYVQNLYQEKLL